MENFTKTSIEIQAWLKDRIAEYLFIEQGSIDIHSDFNSFGLSSRDAILLSGDLEEWLGERFSPTIIYEYPNIYILSKYLSKELAKDDEQNSQSTEKIDNKTQDTSFINEPIAIIGLACKFPGAKDKYEFWDLLDQGTDAIKEIPSDRWEINDYYNDIPGAKGKMISRWGGFIEDIDKFDAEFFGISPREAARMDPQQRLLLEISWHAFEDAGILPQSVNGSDCGVFIGISVNDYANLARGDPELMDAYSGIGNALCIAANRISYFYDLHGPSIAVDTACSSSLVAVHNAIKSLRNRESDMALAGGVNLILTPNLNIVFSHARMLSPDGRCKTFDASADGYVRGEGCGVVVLKRLSDAIRDHNRIEAVVYGSAVNQDGRSNGLTAPNGLAQERVIKKALEDAGLKADAIDYIEAHGTGTSLGDPIELRAIGKIMEGRPNEKPCMVGSVKTNFGHLESAAGIAGLIKVVLSLGHNQIPAHLHFKSINPYIPIEELPIEIPSSSKPWIRGEQRRLAGVSSFGFGGTNAHIILGDNPEVEDRIIEENRLAQIFCLSAKNTSALHKLAIRTREFIKERQDVPFFDFGYTNQNHRTQFDNRLAIVSENKQQLITSLESFIKNIDEDSRYFSGVVEKTNSPVAFLFTGQGSQYIHMAKDLYQSDQDFKKSLEMCDQILEPILGRSIFSVLFPSNEEDSLINETIFTQPILFALEYALSQLWIGWGIQPDFLVGHSLGEYVALVVANVISLEDGLRLVCERARLMGSLPKNGEMANIFASEEVVRELIQNDPRISIAAINGPTHTVISGDLIAVREFIEKCQDKNINTKTLNVSHAFHSKLMEPILDEFEAFAKIFTFNEPNIPIINNLFGLPWERGQGPDSRYLREHLRNPVRFYDCVLYLSKQDCRTFIEIGPQPVLLNMAKRCLVNEGVRERGQVLWLSSINSNENNWYTLEKGISQLFVSGYPVNWSVEKSDYQTKGRICDLPVYPFTKERHWLEFPDITVRMKEPDIKIKHENEEKGLNQIVELYAEAELTDHLVKDNQKAFPQVKPLEIIQSEGDRTHLLNTYLLDQIGRVLNQSPERISIEKPLNFMGLDSIMAIELKNKLEKELSIDLPVAFLIQGPNIVQISELINTLLQNNTVQTEPILDTGEIVPNDNEHKEYPLTIGQKALWFQHQVAPNSVYNPVQVVRIKSRLEHSEIQSAFQYLVKRHPSLRTTFHAKSGEPVQVVGERENFWFEYQDCSQDSLESILDRLTEEAHRIFDLQNGPLLKVFVVKENGNDLLVMVYAHHLVVDLWSLAVLTNELYIILTSGIEKVVFPETKKTYLDFVSWQSNLMTGIEGENSWNYWKEQLSGELPVLNLPIDHFRPAIQTYHGAVRSRMISLELSEKIRQLSEQTGTTIFTILLAVFKVLLFRYSNQEDIIIGTPTTGRSNKDFFNVVGYFVNPLPIRTKIQGDVSFQDYLQILRNVVLGALNHQDLPLPVIVERLHPERDPSILPLFQVMFIFQRSHLLFEEGLSQFAIGIDGLAMKVDGLTIENVVIDQKYSAFDLSMTMAQTNEGLGASITYNTDLFDDATIQRMLLHYETLLSGVLLEPDRKVATLPILTEKERNQLIYDWNANKENVAIDTTVYRQFEEQAERSPDAIAIRFFDQRLTYRELNEKANQLANYLRKLGIGPEKITGIFLERSPELIIAILGVMKAGGGYLPLDPIHPYERLAFMFQDARIPVLITHSRLMDRLPTLIAQPVFIDSYWGRIAMESSENLTPLSSMNNLAYVIYTSGSTGRSKGVMIEHKGVSNLVNAQIKGFEVSQSSVVLQFASFGFDASVSEIFMALLSGATLVMAKRETLLSIPDLIRLFIDEKISVVTLPPSLLSLLPENELPDLRTVISAGESCSVEIAEKWSKNRVFINAYGPTETTIGPTFYKHNGKHDKSLTIPIGKPIPNIQIFILDKYGQLVPEGLSGEICIGGVGLARGYLNRPELTEEKFVVNPFFIDALDNNQSFSSPKIYRTGDLGRYLVDGTIEFLGRVDYQVKIRGFRIELGEIEAIIELHPGVRQAVVILRDEPLDTKKLVAYLVPTIDTTIKLSELRRFIREKLPEYMVPSAFVTMDEFPLTPNGKVDRFALPPPTSDRLEDDINYVSPTTNLEKVIASIWEEVLNVDRVGLNDNFFDMGGHSLLVAKAHSRLQVDLAREFSLINLFRYPTVSTLAEFLSGDVEESIVIQETIERADKQRNAMTQQANRMKSIAKTRININKSED